jgi:copper(I)-binding protein
MFKKALLAPLMVLAMVFSVAACAPAEAGKVEVTGAWVRASEFSDHAGGMTGVFMQITNNTDKAVTLIGGTSDIAAMVETHQVVDGVMSKKEGGIEIKPGETVTLEPGGLHVMLMGLTEAIVVGTKVKLTLKFEGADDIVLPEMLAKTSASGDEEYDPTPMPSHTH